MGFTSYDNRSYYRSFGTAQESRNPVEELRDAVDLIVMTTMGKAEQLIQEV